MGTYRIVIGYAGDAAPLKRELVECLRPFHRMRIIEIWREVRVDATVGRHPDAGNELLRCDCFIPIISPGFLTSDFIEMAAFKALLASADKIDIQPVYGLPCAWHLVKEVAGLDVFPNELALSEVKEEAERDNQWRSLATRICDQANRKRQRIKGTPERPQRPGAVSDKAELHRLTPSYRFPDPRFDKYLDALDIAWRREDMALFSIAGPAEVGKTALVRSWLRALQQREKSAPGPERRRIGAKSIRIFGWSFHDDATLPAQVEAFFNAAARWFGITLPPNTADKARFLTDAFYRNPSVLVLDGLSTRIFEINPIRAGEERAPMEALLLALAERGSKAGNLVVVTGPAELGKTLPLHRDVMESIVLEPLDRMQVKQMLDAGLLRMQPDDAQFSALYVQSRGYPGPVIRFLQAGNQKASTPDSTRNVGHTAFEIHDRNWATDRAERRLMWLVALADRPLERTELDVLLRYGFAGPLNDLEKEGLSSLIDRLETLGLVYHDGDGGSLAADSSTRAFFGEDFRRRDGGAWEQANSVLFDYFSTASRERIDAAEKMESLLRAVHFGCSAGRREEALALLQAHLLNGEQNRFLETVEQLGSLAQTLSVLKPFYSGSRAAGGRWHEENSLQALTGYCLGRCGLMVTAKRTIGSNIVNLGNRARDLGKRRSDPRSVADAIIRSVNDLTDIHLFRGDLHKARQTAEEALELSRRKKSPWRQTLSSARLATVLFHQGELKRSRSLFQEAESLYPKEAGQLPMLPGEAGFNDLRSRLAVARDNDTLFGVLGRAALITTAERQLEKGGNLQGMVVQALYLLASAEAMLSLGSLEEATTRGKMARDILARTDFNVFKAMASTTYARSLRSRGHLDRAIDEARWALAWSTATDDREAVLDRFDPGAWGIQPDSLKLVSDLEETLKLQQLDSLLLLGNLALDYHAQAVEIQTFSSDTDRAKRQLDGHLTRAAQASTAVQVLIGETGSGLRRPEVMLLEARLGYYRQPHNAEKALKMLSDARSLIEEMGSYGQHRLVNQVKTELYAAGEREMTIAKAG